MRPARNALSCDTESKALDTSKASESLCLLSAIKAFWMATFWAHPSESVCRSPSFSASSRLASNLWKHFSKMLAIQITRQDHYWDHSIIASSRHMYMGIIFRAHPVCGESHIKHCAVRVASTAIAGASTTVQ